MLVLAERRELDQAVTTAETMLERAQGIESERIAERVATVADALSPYDARAVREFLTRVRQQARVPL
ncbi:hypothetical protein AB0B56_24565 [Streptosporangium canum]|uniref:hypothetical protein n=1 Tax=Streptosporangium canum TaxID=324952 RepID=UPI0034143799